MKKLLSLSFFLCAVFTSAFAQVNLETDMTPARSISVQPMNNDFALKRGESQDVKISISNRLERKMQFNTYLSDWRRDTIGAHIYTPPGTEPHSCARWITIDKKFIEVDTGQVGVITLKLQIPDSAEAMEEMKWAMLFIESVEEAKAPTQTKEMKSEIVPKTRFGVHIYQTPPSVTDKEIKLLSFTPMPGKKNAFRIIGQNTGKVQLVCKSYIELSALADGKKTSVASIEVPLFPEQLRYFDFELPPTVAKGKYTLVGVIDGGSDLDIQAAQMTIDVE